MPRANRIAISLTDAQKERFWKSVTPANGHNYGAAKGGTVSKSDTLQTLGRELAELAERCGQSVMAERVRDLLREAAADALTTSPEAQLGEADNYRLLQVMFRRYHIAFNVAQRSLGMNAAACDGPDCALCGIAIDAFHRKRDRAALSDPRPPAPDVEAIRQRVRWVCQEDRAGCALACLAMVVGKSYQEVKAAWPEHRRVGEHGIDHHEVMQYLNQEGQLYQLRYRHVLGWNTVTDAGDLRRTRDDWPQPFAPVHIIGVNGGRHDVVLLDDGAVLDPMQSEPRRLSDVGDVSFMVGVWPSVSSLSAQLAQAQQEIDKYRTLSGIGTWHKDCRPNREMAARELQKSQAVIDKLADEISTLNAQLTEAQATIARLTPTADTKEGQ